LAAGFGCLRHMIPTAQVVVALLDLVMVLVDKLREVARSLSGIEGGLQGEVFGGGGFIEQLVPHPRVVA
jgi:hypothetical protein